MATLPAPLPRKTTSFEPEEDVRTLIQVYVKLGGKLGYSINVLLRECLPVLINGLLQERRRQTQEIVEQWANANPFNDPYAWREEKLAKVAAEAGEELAFKARIERAKELLKILETYPPDDSLREAAQKMAQKLMDKPPKQLLQQPVQSEKTLPPPPELPTPGKRSKAP